MTHSCIHLALLYITKEQRLNSIELTLLYAYLYFFLTQDVRFIQHILRLRSHWMIIYLSLLWKSFYQGWFIKRILFIFYALLCLSLSQSTLSTLISTSSLFIPYSFLSLWYNLVESGLPLLKVRIRLHSKGITLLQC